MGDKPRSISNGKLERAKMNLKFEAEMGLTLVGPSLSTNGYSLCTLPLVRCDTHQSQQSHTQNQPKAGSMRKRAEVRATG